MRTEQYSFNTTGANEGLSYAPGELFNFYNRSGIKDAELIEGAFQRAHQSIVVRDVDSEIVGAIRASYDGVYAMIWDLQVNQIIAQNHPELKSDLLAGMMRNLQASGSNLIAAIVPKEDVGFYQSHGLVYGGELTATTIYPNRHVLWDSIHPIVQNDKVTPSEVSNLFAAAGWQEEAARGEQFANAFNTAFCNFTARDDNGKLIGMVRTHFDGKVAMRWNLVVLPEFRKQGVGFKLLSHLLDFIIKGGYESYALAVNQMVPYYQKIGIIPVRDRQVVTNNPKL